MSDFDDEPDDCQDEGTPNGECPCCHRGLENWPTAYYDISGEYQEVCPVCGYEGGIFYDD